VAMRRVLRGTSIVEMLGESAQQKSASTRITQEKRYELDGKSLTLREWSTATDISYHTLRTRLIKGMSISDAIRKPWDRRVSGGSHHVYTPLEVDRRR
jgi:hypothetical protein